MTTPITTPSDDFRAFLEVLALYTEAERQINAYDLQINSDRDELVESIKTDYLNAKAALLKAEEAAIAYAQLHPEWFKKTKTISTPMGSVATKVSSKLRIDNAAVTLRLIRGFYKDAAGDFIRSEEKPNMEALEGLTDDELSKLMISRVRETNYTVKSPKIDLGKSVAVESEVAK